MFSRATPQFSTVMALTLVFAPASSGAQVVRGSDVAFSASLTGYSNAEAPENCPSGKGVSLGAEARTATLLFIGAAVHAHFAGPGNCGGVAIQAPYRDGYADVVADMHLTAAPSATLMVGIQRFTRAPDITLAAAGRWIYASWDDRDGGRTTVPWLGGTLTADGFGRFGVGLELGAIRAPIAWIAAEAGTWEVVQRSDEWKLLWQIGFRFRPWS